MLHSVWETTKKGTGHIGGVADKDEEIIVVVTSCRLKLCSDSCSFTFGKVVPDATAWARGSDKIPVLSREKKWNSWLKQFVHIYYSPSAVWIVYVTFSACTYILFGCIFPGWIQYSCIYSIIFTVTSLDEHSIQQGNSLSFLTIKYTNKTN